jgi:hypothetical protein
MLCEGQPVERAMVMLHRTAVMLEIAAERKGGQTEWPGSRTGSCRQATSCASFWPETGRPPANVPHGAPHEPASQPGFVRNGRHHVAPGA